MTDEELIAALRRETELFVDDPRPIATMHLAADRLQSLTGKSRVGVTDAIKEAIEVNSIGGTDDYPVVSVAGLIGDLEAALPSGVRVKPLDAFIKWAKDQGNFSLGIVRVNGKFHHFSDPDTDTAWLGFSAALSAIEPSQAQGVGVATGAEMITRMSEEEFGRDRSDENPMVGKTAPAPTELEVAAYCRRDPNDTIPEEAAWEFSEDEQSGWEPLVRLTDAQAALTALRAERERLERERDAERIARVEGAHDKWDRAAAAAHVAELEKGRKFKLRDRVMKAKGSSWTGHVVGFYSTTLTPVGYAVESEREPGSVQIYPEAALVGLRADETIKLAHP